MRAALLAFAVLALSECVGDMYDQGGGVEVEDGNVRIVGESTDDVVARFARAAVDWL